MVTKYRLGKAVFVRDEDYSYSDPVYTWNRNGADDYLSIKLDHLLEMGATPLDEPMPVRKYKLNGKEFIHIRTNNRGVREYTLTPGEGVGELNMWEWELIAMGATPLPNCPQPELEELFHVKVFHDGWAKDDPDETFVHTVEDKLDLLRQEQNIIKEHVRALEQGRGE